MAIWSHEATRSPTSQLYVGLDLSRRLCPSAEVALQHDRNIWWFLSDAICILARQCIRQKKYGEAEHLLIQAIGSGRDSVSWWPKICLVMLKCHWKEWEEAKAWMDNAV
jgi:hypothetical protein